MCLLIVVSHSGSILSSGWLDCVSPVDPVLLSNPASSAERLAPTTESPSSDSADSAGFESADTSGLELPSGTPFLLL
eukprot:CAMPEP_0184301690 /NCGR_PEP_ID=MMETSP1049-20130417/11834_1 /TAXON_ID=77928 /ORGANISM="Proteomonas sulcata, Strain CCMP704" /LENGTH=76 /DNA_ID=CAMNT_0026612759 /DNA_START=722 /DNA_END=952 /DNA_ORIENTATION=+